MIDRIVNKYISFVNVPPNNSRIRTEVWTVLNNRSGDVLGEISFSTGWRQYCFFPEWNCQFNNTCLREIVEQIERLNVEQRTARVAATI